VSRPHEVAAVHVWRDEATAQDRGAVRYYSVSEVDSEGEEIRCVGGSRDRLRAWELGLEQARDLGIPCVEYAGPSDQETDRWEPSI